jgi:hypothetical protein
MLRYWLLVIAGTALTTAAVLGLLTLNAYHS